ncbi:MAG: hypothetical protein ABI411_21510 [Tahibacter sp.]
MATDDETEASRAMFAELVAGLAELTKADPKIAAENLSRSEHVTKAFKKVLEVKGSLQTVWETLSADPTADPEILRYFRENLMGSLEALKSISVVAQLTSEHAAIGVIAAQKLADAKEQAQKSE